MLSNAFQSLKLWQAVVLVAVLVGAGGGTYGAHLLVSDTNEADLGEDQELFPVRLGDLVNEVSVNGSLVFPNRQTLTFGTQGTVEDILVEEGQAVREGGPLARLDGGDGRDAPEGRSPGAGQSAKRRRRSRQG